MPNVWYIGSAASRTITIGEWSSVGILSTTRHEWNAKNGWSVPQTEFTDEMLIILDGDPNFLLGQEDAPRVMPSPPDAEQEHLSAYLYYRELKETLQSTDPPLGWRGSRGYGFAGLVAAQDGTAVQGLVESESGPVPVGNAIPVSIAYNSSVTHGTNANELRPSLSVSVMWIGSVQPLNAVDGDLWVDTSGTAPTVLTSSLASLNKDAPTSQILTADGTVPIVWSIQAGTLPAGLTFSSDGQLLGSPQNTGAYSFTVKAQNGYGNDTKAFSGTIGSPIAPTIITTSIADINTGTPYSEFIRVTGSSPLTFSITSGILPTGISLDTSSGELSGNATTEGAYSFTVLVSNNVSSTTRTFTGTVGSTPATIIDSSLGTVWKSFAVNKTIARTGSTPITWAVSSGSMPNGLSLNTSTGVITGTPTAAGSYSFVLQATNTAGSVTKTFSGSVSESQPVIVETALNRIDQGIDFTQTLTTSAGGPTITWNVQTGTIPAGLTMNTSGVISGKATGSGAYDFTVRASNGLTYDDQQFTGTVVGNGPTFVSISSQMTGNSTITAPNGSKIIIFSAYYAGWVSSISPTITLGGTPMTSKGSAGNGFPASYTQWMYAFEGTGTGSAQTITFGGPGPTSAFALVFSNVSAVGAAQGVAYAGFAPAAQNVASANNHMIAQAFFKVSGSTWSGYNQTQKAAVTGMVVGIAPGATTVNFQASTGTQNSDATTICLAVDLS